MKIPETCLDFKRGERIGLDEAILCAGKTVAQIETILIEARQCGARLLLTRLSAEQLEALSASARTAIDYDALSRTGFFGLPAASHSITSVAVISAGTTDLPAAREAIRTLRWYGEPSLEFHDIGVAGLWRLTERLEKIRSFPIVIVAAGMDGALVSVVGGLVGSCVIGLPTSVGYGVANGGQAALNAMLASCAPGLAVVNIDNGYGAASIALRMLRTFSSGNARGGR